MSDCGCDISPESATARRSLRIALGLNATMFVVGLVAGVVAESTGLIANSLDMLADALAYAIGLAAISRSALFKTRAAGSLGRHLAAGLGASPASFRALAHLLVLAPMRSRSSAHFV